MHLGFSSMNNVSDPAPVELAVTLEQAGFESLWYGEHSHIPCAQKTPYPPGGEMPEPYKRMMDPYLSLMAAASVTTTLKLGTGIALLLERELFSQAKTIATLDRLTNGRVLIGTGVGWNEEEFTNATQMPWKRRYLGLKETVLAQRELFSKAEPEYHGELIDFDSVWFEPKPLQMNGPPIILGVMGPLGVRHAAQWADGPAREPGTPGVSVGARPGVNSGWGGRWSDPAASSPFSLSTGRVRLSSGILATV